MKIGGKRNAFACLVLVLVTAGIGDWFWEGVRHRPEARRGMRRFMAQVELGDAKAKERRELESGSYDALSLRTGQRLDLWVVTTPSEVGAGNWMLFLEFDLDELRAMRLRTADGVTTRPREQAPPDKIASGWPREFPRD